MGATNHKDLTVGSIHANVNWSQNSAPTGLTSVDDDKFWWDADGLTLHISTAYATDEFCRVCLTPSATGTTTPDFTAPADLTVTTDLSVGNDATITNDLTVSNDAAVTGNTTLTGTLTITSVDGRKCISINAIAGPSSLEIVEGAAYFSIPEALNGYNLVRAQAIVVTAGVTGATTIDIYNYTDSADMLSGAISIASTEKVGTVGTINTATDDVVTDDVIRIDITTIATGTAPKGLIVTLEFNKP